MDLKLWEYIFEMFNYKIRQEKIDFFKITNLYPALKGLKMSSFFGSEGVFGAECTPS